MAKKVPLLVPVVLTETEAEDIMASYDTESELRLKIQLALEKAKEPPPLRMPPASSMPAHSNPGSQALFGEKMQKVGRYLYYFNLGEWTYKQTARALGYDCGLSTEEITALLRTQQIVYGDVHGSTNDDSLDAEHKDGG